MEKKRKDVDPLKGDRKDDFYYENVWLFLFYIL